METTTIALGLSVATALLMGAFLVVFWSYRAGSEKDRAATLERFKIMDDSLNARPTRGEVDRSYAAATGQVAAVRGELTNLQRAVEDRKQATERRLGAISSDVATVAELARSALQAAARSAEASGTGTSSDKVRNAVNTSRALVLPPAIPTSSVVQAPAPRERDISGDPTACMDRAVLPLYVEPAVYGDEADDAAPARTSGEDRVTPTVLSMVTPTGEGDEDPDGDRVTPKPASVTRVGLGRPGEGGGSGPRPKGPRGRS